MEALGSPMIAAAIIPDLRTMSGFTPKKAGSQIRYRQSFLLQSSRHSRICPELSQD